MLQIVLEDLGQKSDGTLGEQRRLFIFLLIIIVILQKSYNERAIVFELDTKGSQQ